MATLSAEYIKASVEGLQQKLGWLWTVTSDGTLVQAENVCKDGGSVLKVQAVFVADEKGRALLQFQKLAISTHSVMKLLSEIGQVDPGDEEFYSQLYQAASEYGDASSRIVRLSAQVSECLTEIAERGRCFNDIGARATELKEELARRDGAEKLFVVLCGLRGIEVVRA